MSLPVAVRDLRDRLRVFEARLRALGEQTQAIGGGSVHTVVEQVDKAAVDALGWARKARAASKRAARPGAGQDEVRAALTDVQRGLDELRRKEPRRLRGRTLSADLADMCRHQRAKDADWRRLGIWAKETIPAVQGVCAAVRAADAAMAVCWRELATNPASRVRVKTVTEVE